MTAMNTFYSEIPLTMQINCRDDTDSIVHDPFYKSGLPRNMDGNAMQLNFNNSIWGTAFSIVYNDGLPMKLQCFPNLPAPAADSVPGREAPSQHDSNALSGFSVDLFTPFPSVEHLGRGLL
jgi:hypothetical protein